MCVLVCDRSKPMKLVDEGEEREEQGGSDHGGGDESDSDSDTYHQTSFHQRY